MLHAVSSRRTAFNNDAAVSRSRVFTLAKLLYYRLFAWLYGVVGRRADLVMVLFQESPHAP